KYYEQTVGRFFPEFDQRAVVIHNGLDWSKFTYTPPKEILEYLPIQPNGQPILLHPHRPEATKGIYQTIAVVDLLVHQHGITDLIALAPQWMEHQLTPELSEFYAGIEHEIRIRGLEKNFVFHGWIPQPLMPQYYSLGSVTLSLGSFPESFGNAVYESLGCGTPSVVARIATHRELLPENLIDKVDYDDVHMAAEKSAQIIKEKRRTSQATMDYIHTHYSTERQLSAYADAILNAEVVAPMRYNHQKLDASTRYGLPVWCYLTHKGVYNDFWAAYHPLGILEGVIREYPHGFTIAQAQSEGVSDDVVVTAYRNGFLAPMR
ncbi:MAG TPA: glycosyltransferase, partial [Aggregatilineales bacterium]|nr:glycosyltransferase [Aggregatilineales bacterium]